MPPPLSHKQTNQTSTPSDNEVGERLRHAREQLGFTQAAVSARSRNLDPDGKGVSRTSLVGYEQGISKPGLREIRLLCEVLTITPNWLIFGDLSATNATLPSLQLTKVGHWGELDAVLRTAIALTSLKGHERDALHSLALSLAGRQLGDERLSALVMNAMFMRDAFYVALKDLYPDLDVSAPLEQIAEVLSREGVRTNFGNRFNYTEDGDPVDQDRAVYRDPSPDPGPEKSEN